MPVFEYTALDIKGKAVSGIIDADGSVAARQKVRELGVFPVTLKEVQDAAAKKERRTIHFKGSFARIRPAEVTMMTRQLATLVGAGFPLVPAIDALIPQTKTPAFKRKLAQIKDAILEGNSFAGVLSLHPKLFSPLYINMVRAGETSGTLEIVLDRLADMMEKQQDLTTRIKTALTYPLLMSVFGAVVLFFLLTVIVPNITTIYSDMNQVLPLPTRILIAVSNLFKGFWWVIVLLIIGIVLGIGKLKKTEKGRYYYDQAALSLPGFGSLINKLAVARLSRTLGSLLENGVTMLTALGIVKNIVGNILIADAVEAVTKEVGQGTGIGAAMAESRFFPNLSIQMIQVGEQSGKLEPMLNKVADVFEKEVETRILRITALLEPIMIILMAVVTLFIVLSICLPIFEMNQLIG